MGRGEEKGDGGGVCVGGRGISIGIPYGVKGKSLNSNPGGGGGLCAGMQ